MYRLYRFRSFRDASGVDEEKIEIGAGVLLIRYGDCPGGEDGEEEEDDDDDELLPPPLLAERASGGEFGRVGDFDGVDSMGLIVNHLVYFSEVKSGRRTSTLPE